ncbi:alpha-1,2 mannosyltransferase Ktr1p [Monosporozyma unispora]|nr:alpha-1,2-mannosyltransferase ktr1 [Kazachstania unispora]
MGKLTARNSNPQQQRLYKRIGLAIIVLFTFFMLYNGSSSNGTSNGVLKQNTETVIDSDGYLRNKVSYTPYKGKKVKATFVTLARNSDLYELLPAIKSVEDRFNHKFQYDWVFLNDVEFSDEFKNVTSALISGKTKYGVIPKEHWSFPDWIDQDKAAKVREEMREKQIIYGDSISYRHMCRFESGFFYRHPLMDDYDWYWRVEPGVKLTCDIDYDLFKFMEDNGKKYAFTISIHEYLATIPTLWDVTRKFMQKHPEYLPEDNMLDFISDDNGLSYNLCHFWSNFEVASLDFWRGPAYSAYFDYLDHAGGFFYERWGDAPVHSIGAALFLKRDEIHFFGDVGYYHPPFYSCNIDDEVRLANKCECNPDLDFTFNGYSCTTKFFTINDMTKPNGWQEHVNKRV